LHRTPELRHLVREVAVDRFEDRHAASRAQHAIESTEGGLLVIHVDEHRPGSHDVDRLGGDRLQTSRPSDHERHPVDFAGVGRDRSRDFDQIGRHVGRDHVAFSAYSLQGSERDQAVAGANVEQDIPGTDLRVVQYSVPDRKQILECPRTLLWIVPVAAVK
jgi:hypothetical protein